MKIERIEVNAHAKTMSYTLVRWYTGKKPQYRIWIYSHVSHTGSWFKITRNQFFRKMLQLQMENALTYYTICTEKGFGMVYPISGVIHYEKYDFKKF